jgi:hypothetical protein
VTLTFAVERIGDVWGELYELGKAHWHETEQYRHGQPFDPRLERYAHYEGLGVYMLFTARCGGKLVGNFGVYLGESMHTQECIATEDTCFLLPKYRRGRAAIDFVKHVRDQCIALGAVEVMFTAKNPRVGKLLRYLDFQPVSETYSYLRAGADSTTSHEAVGVHTHDAPSPISSRPAGTNLASRAD